VDGIQLDDQGFDKMARLWFRGIQETMDKGFIDSSNRILGLIEWTSRL
jgi:hypothetical protein